MSRVRPAVRAVDRPALRSLRSPLPQPSVVRPLVDAGVDASQRDALPTGDAIFSPARSRFMSPIEGSLPRRLCARGLTLRPLLCPRVSPSLFVSAFAGRFIRLGAPWGAALFTGAVWMTYPAWHEGVRTTKAQGTAQRQRRKQRRRPAGDADARAWENGTVCMPCHLVVCDATRSAGRKSEIDLLRNGSSGRVTVASAANPLTLCSCSLLFDCSSTPFLVQGSRDPRLRLLLRPRDRGGEVKEQTDRPPPLLFALRRSLPAALANV
jgi:hypothetical protein